MAYTTFYLNSSFILMVVVNCSTVLFKELLSFYLIYIGISLTNSYKKNRVVALIIILMVLLSILVSIFIPQRIVLTGNQIGVTTYGKISIVRSILITLTALYLILRYRKRLYKTVPLFRGIRGAIFIYIVVDILGSIRLLLVSIYSIDYLGSYLIKLKVFLLPLIFIYICYKSLGAFSKRTKKVDLTQFDLTNKEMEVLDHILMGLKNSNIEKELNIKKSTLKTHINRIFSKVGVESRLELIFKLKK